LKSITPDTYSVTTFSPFIGVPYAVACTSNFIFYGGGGTIYKNTFSGQSQTIFKTSAATLITALACDLSNVYVVADNVNYILSINIQTANVTFLVNSTNASGYTDSSDPTLVRFNRISAICIDSSYKYLYISLLFIIIHIQFLELYIYTRYTRFIYTICHMPYHNYQQAQTL
jgi:hypothetical protein